MSHANPVFLHLPCLPEHVRTFLFPQTSLGCPDHTGLSACSDTPAAASTQPALPRATLTEPSPLPVRAVYADPKWNTKRNFG